MTTTSFVLLEPEELQFREVKLSQVYTQTVRVTNTLRGPVELSIKPGSSERYTVVPSTLRLRSEESGNVEVRLRVLRFAQRQKAVEQGQRDVFHIKGSHFDQKFYATFWLSHDTEQPSKPKPGAAAASTTTQARGGVSENLPSLTRSPSASPPRSRRAVTKSVSFAEPDSPRGGSQRSALAPAASFPAYAVSANADAAAAGAGSRIASGTGGSSPQHVRSGLRQALAGLLSPQRSAALSTMEGDAYGAQRVAGSLDRTQIGVGTAVFRPSAVDGMSPARPVSASIDFGQLTGFGGEAQTGYAAGGSATSPARDRTGASTTGLAGNRPPRGPSRSLHGSPGHGNTRAASGTPSQLQLQDAPPWAAAGTSAGPTSAGDGTGRSDGGGGPPARVSLPAATGVTGVAGLGFPSSSSSPAFGSVQGSVAGSVASSPSSRGMQPAGAAGSGASPNRLPVYSDTLPNARKSPVRVGWSQPLEQEPAPSPRREGLGRPLPTPAPHRASASAGSAGQLASNPDGRPHRRIYQDERARREAEERQFLEDEARALGLHLAKDSIRSLGVEAGRILSRSESSPPPSFASPARRSAELTSPGGRSGGADGRQTHGRSRSSEMLLQPPPHPPQPTSQPTVQARPTHLEPPGQSLELQRQTQSWERQQASMHRTIEQQQEVLRDKAAIIRSLQEQLETTKAELNAYAASKADSPSEQLVAERSLLLAERSGLAARLAEAEAALVNSREEAAALRRLQLELQSRQPEVARAVEAALMREQALQDERNRQALELLMGKDSRIQELEEQVAGLEHSNAKLRAHIAELQAQAQAAESKVFDVLRQKEALVEAAQQERQQTEHTIADLESRVAASECLRIELLAAQERAAVAEARQRGAEAAAAEAEQRTAAAEARGREAERAVVAAEQRAARAEARASSIETMRSHFSQRRDDQVDGALAMAEELRSRSVALQEQHADAMRLQGDAHRQQVAQLEARISDLMAELSRVHSAASGTNTTPTKSRKHSGYGPHGPMAPASSHPPLDNGVPDDPRNIITAMLGGLGRGGGESNIPPPPSGGVGVVDLEVTNAKLEGEVQALRRQLSALSWESKERTWEQAELDRLRTLISERDIEVAELTSQLEVLKARLGSGGGAHAGAPAHGGRRATNLPNLASASPPASPPRGGKAGPTTSAASPARGRQHHQQQQQPPVHQGGRGRSRSLEREPGAGSDDGQAAVVEVLRQQLAKSEAALRGAQERLALMEARAAVAQETAGRGEQQLEAVQRSMVGSALEHQRLQQDLESARATASRLNGRINDLVSAEQVARAEVDAAKAKLGQLQELHSAEVSGLRERLQRVSEHLAATQPEVLQVLLGPEYMSFVRGCAADLESDRRGSADQAAPGDADAPGGHHGLGPQPGDGPAAVLSRERELEKAVDAAETAVAVMQDRLLAALKVAADAGEEAARVRREAEWERDRLEAEVRSAREEGALRIRNLEEAVSRLGARGGDAAQALARSMAEADAATRREARLRSELTLAQQAAQRANTQAAELRLQLRDCDQALREAQVYGGLLPVVYDMAGPGRGQPASAAPQAALQAASPQCKRGLQAPEAPQAPFVHAASRSQLSGAGAAPFLRPPAETSGGGCFFLDHLAPIDVQLESKLRERAVELARRQQVIARLVEVAERAQAEAADTQAELNMLKQAMPDPKQYLHQQYAEVQRRLGATEAELRACREAKAASEIEVSRLQQQLIEKARELDVASERLVACERDIAAKEEAAGRKAVEVRGAMSKEVALLSQRAAEAQRAADEAEARARELDTQLGNLRAELAEARAEMEAQAAEVRQARLKGRDEKRAAEEAARLAKRAAELAKQDAHERRNQLTIMMETVEVLQAGNPGEREQRIVSLTAQLSAMTSRESLAEQRAEGLLADVEASSCRVQQLQSEVADLSQQVGRLEQQLAAAASNRMLLEGELAAARSDVRTRDVAALRAARELDDREQRVATLESELEALRRALHDCQGRHAEQLAREREDAAAAVRQARAESSAAAAASSQAARLERFQATFDELVAWIESRTQHLQQPPQQQQIATAAAGEDGAGELPSFAKAPTEPGSWLTSAMQRLKAVALESEREYLAASADARLYRSESRWAWSRVQRLQWTLEQRTGEWQVAQARVQHLERALRRRSEDAAVHALEQVALQDKQLAALNDRLQATMTKLVVATSQAAGAEAALNAARATAAALQRQAAVAAAERKELMARLTAAEMEAAGSVEALHLGTEAALAQRDLAIRQYLDSQVANLLAKTDVRDKVMALAREICSLKLSESQLQATLAAAKHRGDASAQLVASLTAALRASEEMVEQALSQQLANGVAVEGGEASGTAAAGQIAAGAAGAGGLGVEVARLSAQLVAQSHEMFRLQEAALRAKQAYERRESDIEELQAQLAAAELLLTQARTEGSAALCTLREQLSELHEQDRQLLLREIRELQDRLTATRDLASKDVEFAEQRVAEMASAVDAEIEKRVSAALAGQVDAAHLHDAEARAVRAETRVSHLETQIEAMQEALTAAEAQVVELQDVRDVTGAAVASLEATLARIEKGAASGGPGAGGASSCNGRLFSGGARRVPFAGSSQSAPGAPTGQSSEQPPPSPQQQPAPGVAGLSRELMRAKMAEAEAVRKMRAAARSEVDLRQKLLQRDERIAELKEDLAAKTRSLEDLRRRMSLTAAGGEANHALRAAAAGPGGRATGTVGGAKPSLRSRSPSPVRGGVAVAAATGQGRPGASSSSAPSTRRAVSESAVAAAAVDPRVAVDAADTEYLAEQMSALRVDLAKRQAEIERLQGLLAEANAAAVVRVEAIRPPAVPGKPGGQGGSASIDRLRDQLATANAEIVSALSTANGLLLRMNHRGLDVPGHGASIGARRAVSPVRRAASAPGTAPSPDPQLSPGALAGVMQQLAAAVQATLPACNDPARGQMLGSTRGRAARAAGAASKGNASAAAGGSPTRRSTAGHEDGAAAAGEEELRRLREGCSRLERQRDELDVRCGHLEGQLQRCHELVKHLRASTAGGQQHAAQASKLQGAAHYSELLQGSVAALHSVCDRMQDVLSGSSAPPDGIQQAVGDLASELSMMDTTVGLLKAELHQAAAEGLPAQRASNASVHTTPAASGLSYDFSEPVFTALTERSGRSERQGGSSAAPEQGAGGLRASDCTLATTMSWDSLSSGAATATTHALVASRSTIAGEGPELAKGEAASVHAAQEQQALARSVVSSRASGGQEGPLSAVHSARTTSSSIAAAPARDGPTSNVTHAQAVSLATAAAKHKARADKWKQRSKELGAQLSLLNASAAAREAAVSERHVASVQQLEEELRSCRDEAARLKAALSGAEAARRELEAAHSSSGDEVRSLAARAAEASARAATLERQLETERAQAAALLASHQEEVAALKATVAQEKGERARMLVALRESHSSAQQAGDSEAPFRNEALEAHATAAAARAAAERAEERAAAWRSEADTLRQRLQQTDRSRMQLLASLEVRLAAAERRATEVEEVASRRLEELSAKLVAAQAEAAAVPAALESQLQQLEQLLRTMESRSEAARQSAMSGVQVGRWDALTRIVRYQATIKQLQAEMDLCQAEWERERAALQLAATEAVRRGEAVAADLEELRLQMAELQTAVDADRQYMVARHQQELHQRLDAERRALTEEALARAHAAAAASERAAQQSAAARLEALEGELGRRLAEVEAARRELVRELELVQQQFGQYQAQKAAEVAGLEQHLRTYIEGASGASSRRATGSSSGGGGSLGASAHHAGGRATAAPAGAAARRGAAAALHHRGGRGPSRRLGGRAVMRPRDCHTGGPLDESAAAAAGLSPPPPPPHTLPTQEQGTQQQQHPGLAPSQVVALARGSEALAAAQREAMFERALRGRAEAQAAVLRGAMSRLRAKLRAASEQLQDARVRAISPDEHKQLQGELQACREQLKAARAESARRQKALQALQGMAMAQPGAYLPADPSIAASTALPANAAAAALRGRNTRFATAPAAGPCLRASIPTGLAGGATGLSASAQFPLPPGGLLFESLDGGVPPGGRGLAPPLAAAATVSMALEDDPLPAALEAAAANARATAEVLQAERTARQAVEAKLREAKATVERKAAMIKELKRRVEELELAVQRAATSSAEEAGAESRARSLAAALGRKDALIKELRERLEASQASLAAGSAAAEAGGEELEATRRANTRLRAEGAKRDAALRAALGDLDRERKALAGANRQLDELARREAAARRQAATAGEALRRRVGQLVEALRALSQVLLQAVAAMDTAADRLVGVQAAGAAAAAPAAAASSGGGLSAHDICQLTSLSMDDVQHLLGAEAGGAGGALYPLSAGGSGGSTEGSGGRACAASLQAAQRVGELLSMIEVAMVSAAESGAAATAGGQDTSALGDTLEEPLAGDGELLRDQLLAAVASAADPAAAATAILRARNRPAARAGTAATASNGPAGSHLNGGNRRGGGGGAAAAADGGDPWDSRTLQVLVEQVQLEAQRAEGELAAALRDAGAL